MSQPSMTHSAERGGDALVSGLADRIRDHLSATTVYGTPVERDGVTVVPVAVARLAFGGGSGTDPSKQQEGEGAGAAGTVTPTGYIELKDGRSRFVPVVHPARMLAIVLAAAVAVLIVLRPDPVKPKRLRR